MSNVVSSKKPLVVGGKLKLKGSGGGSSSVKRSVNVPSEVAATKPPEEAKPKESSSKGAEYLTASQKRHMERKIEKEKEDAKKMSKTSFRDRVEMFNNKLAQMTEHNDIPRISAAGNG
jgi:protein FAM32A